jgi:UDP-N-acetylmuramate--alanine ligase
VFQPHTYTRTKLLLDEFAQCFDGADRVIITDIYAARERDTGEIHSSHLVKAISERGGSAVYIPGFREVVRYLSENLQQGDLVLTVGAGDVYKVGEMLLEADNS